MITVLFPEKNNRFSLVAANYALRLHADRILRDFSAFYIGNLEKFPSFEKFFCRLFGEYGKRVVFPAFFYTIDVNSGYRNIYFISGLKRNLRFKKFAV